MIKNFIKFSILGFLAVLFVACSEAPSDVAKNFTQDLYDGKGDKLATYISLGKEANEAGVKEMLNGKMQMATADALKRASAKGGVDKIEVANETIKGNNASVEIKVSFKDGSNKIERFKLSDSEGEWKILLK